jgi:hypothetical protein
MYPVIDRFNVSIPSEEIRTKIKGSFPGAVIPNWLGSILGLVPLDRKPRRGQTETRNLTALRGSIEKCRPAHYCEEYDTLTASTEKLRKEVEEGAKGGFSSTGKTFEGVGHAWDKQAVFQGGVKGRSGRAGAYEIVVELICNVATKE